MSKIRYVNSLLFSLFCTFSVFCNTSALLATPLNDSYANAQVISATSGSVNGSNLGAAAKESGEPVPYGSTGYSVWYKWTAPVGGGFTFTTTGSDFTNVIQIYTGVAVNSLQGVSNFSSGSGTASCTLTFNAIAGTTYSIQILDYHGATGNFTLGWSAGPANDNFDNAPTLTGVNGSINGTNANSSVEAGEPLPYRSSGRSVWYRWTAPTNNGFTFTTAGSSFNNVIQVYTGAAVNGLHGVPNFSSGSGTASCTLTFNAIAGTTYSIQILDYQNATGNFTLGWSAGPDNDNFNNAKPITGTSGSISGTNANSSVEAGEPLPYRSSGRSVWYRWTAPTNNGFTFTTAGSSFNNVIQVYTGAAVNGLHGVPNFSSGSPTTSYSFTFNAIAGTTYSIQILDYQNATGNFTLGWLASSPVNDNFANATVISGKSIDLTGTNSYATFEVNEPLLYREAGRSVWYRWTAATTGTASFCTRGSNFKNMLGVYIGTNVGSLTNISGNSSGAGTNSYLISFAATAGTVYNIAVTDYNGETGNFVLFGGQAPINDNFANASAITGGSGTVHGINLPATSEPGEPLHADVVGGTSIWYKWTASHSGTAVLTTDGSDFNTLLGVYTGSDVSHLTTIVSDDYYAGGINGSSMVTWSATAGVIYYIAVDGFQGLFGHVALNYTLPGSAQATTSILLQDSNSHQIAIWSMVDASFSSTANVSITPASDWKAVGVGDFNGDAKPDLVLQNTALNKIALWYLNGATVTGGAYVSASLPAGWNVVGTGDFNGDGKTDLVLQNASSNVAAIWYLNGATLTGGAYVSVTPPAGWKVVGAGDFNSDGKTDLVLQNPSINKIALWYLNGAALTSGAYVSVALPVGWNVAGSADFNGDGKRDLVLQNSANYNASIWHLNGAARIDASNLSTMPPSGWNIVGAN